MDIKAFYDEPTNTVSYVVSDEEAGEAAIVDSVLDFDYASGTISYVGADAILAYIEAKNLTVTWHIETHVHADHLSAAPYLQEKLGGKIGISDQIIKVQNVFGKMFNAGTRFERDGSQFDHLFTANEIYQIGNLHARAMPTPGHTPACMTHIIEDAAFVGDTLFMPDGGTARTDFPGGDAGELYRSIQKILALPPETRIFVCHDYAPNGRAFAWETSVAEERARNIHLANQVSEEEFVAMRQARDETLDMPQLIMPSIQVNMRAGHMPPGEDNGQVYLKVPISDPRHRKKGEHEGK
jgi:glyoxylase-like metal-dependent hydrolase (beta-lactamase superfamily II)